MRLSCNLSGSEYDCSSLFEGVDVSVTSLQACFAAVILLISVPTNLLLIVAMIVYHRLLDKASALAVSLLISNTLASVLINGEVFITTVSRAWLFGHWGCHLIASIAILGLYSRCITVGFLSVDRFCRVFFPFSYPRSENKALAVLLIASWVFSIFIPIMAYFCKITGFHVTYPGCMLAVNFQELSQGNRAVVCLVLGGTTLAGTVLPSILYTAMYLKGRTLRRVQSVRTGKQHTDSSSPEYHVRSNRATITYALMVVIFSAVSVMVFVKMGAEIGLAREQSTVSPSAALALLFFISTLMRSYVIGDIAAIILSNRDERRALYKLICRIFKFLLCNKTTASHV